MVIYTCCDGTDGLLTDLCSEQGFPILTEILRTASAVGLKEDWLKLILSKICIEGSYISLIFFKLHSYPSIENNGVRYVADQFVIEQSYLLTKERSSLQLGLLLLMFLRYSLTILRDICACDRLTSSMEESSKYVVDMLVSSGLIEFLLDLPELEPPTTIRKAMKQDPDQGRETYWKGNAENQGAVADLELQGTVDVPELAGLGLQVEVDPVTRRTRLVNVP
ncbi:hypothetical protein HAX54_031803 [Datura stramonium]|uniref:Uncharacterized protein n=1 Tax=Datura stramonium TaxID=4076 RepID=A0ABS8V9P1_DATST|nr:hypothetical protein [Datura stramonium]